MSMSRESLPSMEASGLNLKATELRLGLPGSESPERNGGGVEGKNGFSLPVPKSGAKRVFSDAIDGRASGKWGLSGSETGLGKCGNLVSPRGVNAAKSECEGQPTVKDGVQVQQSLKPLPVKKPQVPAPAAKAQVVGWPPIRSFRKNSMASMPQKKDDDVEGKIAAGRFYVKVSMDGAPYLRKVDLNTYGSYADLSLALEKMFSCFTIGQCGTNGDTKQDGSNKSRLTNLLEGVECVITYEDKDGDWMLVGDVPWKMFTHSCRRMRIMKSSEAIGLAPRETQKCKNN